MCRAIPARPRGKAARIAVAILLPVLLGACATANIPSQPAVAGSPSEASEGARLYRQYCANCHRPLARTAKPDRTVSRIHSAIRHIAPMHFLDELSIEELRSIAGVLDSKRSAP